jgi:hypothetical protein
MVCASHPRPGPDSFGGPGRWDASGRHPIAGRRFKVDFVLRDLRLYMTMVIDLADGSRRTIKAVFDRPWLGA